MNLPTKKLLITTVVALTVLSACSSTPTEKMTYNPSYLLKDKSLVQADTKTEQSAEKKSTENDVETIKPFTFIQNITTKDSPIIERFSESKKVKLAADELPLNEFLHYVMGEVLQVSYILGDSVKADEGRLTLNLIESVSHKKLFTLVEDLLAERQYAIRYNDGIYYVNQEESRASQGEVIYGYGNKVSDVPLTSQEIWQLAPFNYAYNGGLQLPLMRIAKITIQPDPKQNMFILKGKHSEIIKALEFIQLFDKPDAGRKEIAMYTLEFSDPETIIGKLTQLLLQEGITLGAKTSALSIISLPNINTLTFFANTADVIKRALFWVKKIDQPEKGNEIQYFIYAPQFSRASDLGESLQALISGSTVGNKTSARSQNNRAKTSAGRSSSSNENVSLVIDDRSNSLIFQTTGDEYRKLLPFIKRLDVMPKQIMLEVIIAEVQLTDAFKHGVSFSLTNRGKAIDGGFNLSGGTGGLSYVLSGIKGAFNIDLFQTNSLVNILSRPSLLVRDGVTASMNVGNDIPTVGEIISDPTNGSRTSVVYRKTGVELSVTPTINAQGVVIMEISTSISNQTPGGDAVAGSPVVFQRDLKTEVVAESGETIILGGLISENKNSSDSNTPIFSSLPLIGKLFDTNSKDNTKSELVIMVTPRVIERNEQWQHIRQKLAQEYKYLDIAQ